MMVGIGVVGAGYWGPNLIRNFTAIEKCHLRGVCDHSDTRLTAMQNLYPDVKMSRDLKELLDDPEIKGIAVATPVATHYDLATRILKSGKSVFVEKPLARTSQECRDLISLAAERNLSLMVGHTFVYNPAVSYIGNLIENGDLGEVYYIYCQRLNLGLVRQDVNAMWNLAPHDISIALHWLSSMPVSVNAKGHTYLQDGVEDVVYIDLEFGNGVAVHIHVSWLDPNKVRRITVVGSEKMAVYDDVSPEAKVQLFDKGIDRHRINASLGEFDSFGKFQLAKRAGDILIPKIDLVEPLRVECCHFVDCIENDCKPITSGESGMHVVRTLEAATLSLKKDGVSIPIN